VTMSTGRLVRVAVEAAGSARGNAADSGSSALTTVSSPGTEGEGKRGSIGDGGAERAEGVNAGILIPQLAANG